MRRLSDPIGRQFPNVFVFRVRNRSRTLFELPQKSKFRPPSNSRLRTALRFRLVDLRGAIVPPVLA